MFTHLHYYEHLHDDFLTKCTKGDDDIVEGGAEADNTLTY